MRPESRWHATRQERGVYAAEAGITEGALELADTLVAGGRLCGLKAALRGCRGP